MLTGKYRIQKGSGFTLVELLLSLGIMAIIAAIVLGGFRVGARVWEKASTGIDLEQRTRTILTRLRHQLVAIDLESMLSVPNESLSIGGEASTLRIVSHTSLFRQGDNGPYYCRIEVEDPGNDTGTSLQITEIPLTMVLDVENKSLLDKSHGRDVFTGIHKMKFDYLHIQETEFTWETEWNPKEDDWIPKALRFYFQREEKSPPVEIVAAFPHEQTRFKR